MRTLFVALLLCLANCWAQEPDEVSDDDYQDPSKISNWTYAQHMDKLHTFLLQDSDYDRRSRPVKNESASLQLWIHAVLQHYSVDELQQTIDLMGFLYMSWSDEYLWWPMSDYGNVNRIWVHGWQIWAPKLKIQNAAQGRAGAYAIDWYTHALVIPTNPPQPKYGHVSMFPKFGIKITCVFDYSDYPNDVQKCPLIMYARDGPLSEIEFSIYTGNPSLSLTWDWFTEDKKQHISNWFIQNITQNIAYWTRSGITTTKPPAKDLATAWSVYQVWITLRRHEPYYAVIVRLPAVMSSLVTVSAFFITDPQHRMYVLLGNILVQAVFTRDLIQRLPPSIGALPKIVTFYGFNLVLTFIALCVLLAMHKVATVDRPVPMLLSALLRLQPFLPCTKKADRKNTDQVTGDLVEVENQPNLEEAEKPNYNKSWLELAELVTILCAIVYAFFYFVIMCALL